MSDNDLVLLMDAVQALRLERGTKALMMNTAYVPTADRTPTAYVKAPELTLSFGKFSAKKRIRLVLLR